MLVLKQAIIAICLICLIAAGCSMTRMSANQTVSIFVKASVAYDRESDLEFAEQAGLSNLKMAKAQVSGAEG